MTTRTLGERTGRRTVGEWANSLSTRWLMGVKEREDARLQRALAVPTVRERQAELIEFYELYEDLVETLCDAAQLGATEKLEARYQRIREQFSRAYPSVRKYVVAFLNFSADDAAQGLALWGRSADAFEALIAAPNLSEFLRADDGTMISRINRTRDALSMYGEHLRQLARTA